MINNLRWLREYYRKVNENREYEYQIFIEHRTGKEKVDFYKQFVEVFWEEWDRYLIVDEWIWFITDWETIYISKEFLEECLEKWIKWEKALDLYDKQLEEYEKKENWN